MGAFLSPAQRGIVPELLPASDIVAGNSLLASAQSATRIVGPTAASLIVVSFGGGWAVALDALSYLVAGAVMARLPRSGRITAPARRLRADLAEGWSTFSHTRWILVTTVCIGLMNVITAGPWQILGPLLAQSNYGATTWGFALSCRAAGLLVMSLVMYRTSFTYLLRVSLLWGSLGGATLLALGLGQPIAIVLVLASSAVRSTVSRASPGRARYNSTFPRRCCRGSRRTTRSSPTPRSPLVSSLSGLSPSRSVRPP